MATRKIRHYKSIIDYLERVDDTLYDVIHTLCLDYKLSAEGKPGVTFLLPTDPEFRKELARLVSTENPEDDKKATQYISSLIIYDAIKSPSEFRKMEEIVNDLKQVVEVDQRGTSASEVVFKSGAKATLDTRFRENCRRDDLYVYLLTGGRLPLDAPAAKSRQPRKRAGKEKKPETNPEPKNVNSLRFSLGGEVENAYIYRKMNEGPQSDEYRDTVLSFLSFLFKYRDRKVANEILYDRVLPLVSRQWPADFYLIFETRTIAPDYLVPEIILEEWLETRRNGKKTVNHRDTLTQLNKLLDATNRPQAVYAQRINLLTAIDDVRRDLEELPYRDLIDRCRAEYQKFVEKNAVGSVTNVLPQPLLELYQRDKDLRLLEDEFRQYMLLEFMHLERLRPNELMLAYDELMEKIGDYLNNYVDKAYVPAVNRLRVFNAEMARCANSEVRRHLAMEFLQSSNFMHVPLTPTDCSNEQFPHEEYTLNRPSQDNNQYWNIELLMMKRLDRLYAPKANDSSNDDVEARAIEKLMRKHGDRLGEDIKKTLTAELKTLEDKKSRTPKKEAPAPEPAKKPASRDAKSKKEVRHRDANDWTDD